MNFLFIKFDFHDSIFQVFINAFTSANPIVFLRFFFMFLFFILFVKFMTYF